MSGKPSADTERALRLVAKGMTPYAAAKKVGIALSTIYRALKRLKQQSHQP
jgi:transposase